MTLKYEDMNVQPSTKPNFGYVRPIFGFKVAGGPTYGRKNFGKMRRSGRIWPNASDRGPFKAPTGIPRPDSKYVK